MSQTAYTIVDPAIPSAACNGRCALVVMAKVPRAGRVKTRLSPPLTPEEAAALNIAFLRDTCASLASVAATHPATCVISYTPAGEEEGFRGIVPDDFLLVLQRGDGFGERLLYTAADLFAAGFSAVCLIDSDSPTVPTAAFAAAVQALLAAGPRAVLGPSDDGGYYVIGMNALQPLLFKDITWSTEHVCRETLARASEVELPVKLLPTWFDVDDRRSLARLYRELVLHEADTNGFTAPKTKQQLLSLPSEVLAGLEAAPRNESLR